MRFVTTRSSIRPGSNYFHYVCDLWGSYAECPSEIDHILVDCEWNSANHSGHDAF